MRRIVVATQQGGLDDQVSPVFGRCQTYTIVDAEEGEVGNTEVVQNQYANAMSGAGIQAAGFAANQGAEAVIAGNFGPNVASVLNQSGVTMVPASGISVKEAVRDYLEGELEPVSEATSAAKRGMGGGRGMGMGRGMRGQQTSQRPIQGSSVEGQKPEGSSEQETSGSSGTDSIEDLEKRLKNLEDRVDEVMKGLEELKGD